MLFYKYIFYTFMINNDFSYGSTKRGYNLGIIA